MVTGSYSKGSTSECVGELGMAGHCPPLERWNCSLRGAREASGRSTKASCNYNGSHYQGLHHYKKIE